MKSKSTLQNPLVLPPSKTDSRQWLFPICYLQTKDLFPHFFPDILQIDCSGWDPTGALWDIYNTLCNSSPSKHSLKPQKSIILAVICLLSDQYKRKKKRKHKKFDLIEKIHFVGGKCGENIRFLWSVISFYGFLWISKSLSLTLSSENRSRISLWGHSLQLNQGWLSLMIYCFVNSGVLGFSNISFWSRSTIHCH